jgi:putative hemolysin
MHLADHIIGAAIAEEWSAVFLTATTLFFVELLPKNIGVINAERVGGLMVPPINVLANAMGPFRYRMNYLAKLTLHLIGVKVTIDHSKQEMIKFVLNLQDCKVWEIMKPRVKVVAIPLTMSIASIMGVVRESGYSSIPVYIGEITNTVRIVLAKSVLDILV